MTVSHETNQLFCWFFLGLCSYFQLHPTGEAGGPFWPHGLWSNQLLHSMVVVSVVGSEVTISLTALQRIKHLFSSHLLLSHWPKQVEKQVLCQCGKSIQRACIPGSMTLLEPLLQRSAVTQQVWVSWSSCKWYKWYNRGGVEKQKWEGRAVGSDSEPLARDWALQYFCFMP